MDFLPIFAMAAGSSPASAASMGQRWMFRDREPNWSDAYLGYIRFGGVVWCLLAIGAASVWRSRSRTGRRSLRAASWSKPGLDATRSVEGWSAAAMQSFADEHELT